MSGLIDLAYVKFTLPDLSKQAEFLRDFGFEVTLNNNLLLARGFGSFPFSYMAEVGDAAFKGMAFAAESEADLRRIAAIDNVEVVAVSENFNGLSASLTDPDGFEVEIFYTTELDESGTASQRSKLNNALEKNRIGERVEFTNRSPSLQRLGHCVIDVTNFQTSLAWYQKRLGLIISDEVYIGDEANTLGAFLRLNRGETYVDHHTLFLVGTGTRGFNHAAFEISNWDDLMLGHHQLLAAGHRHKWGVGKHKLGSQVFDYWQDPFGFSIEHFTDGDLFNEAWGSHKASVDDLLAVHWGHAGTP